ncbi:MULTISPECIES: TetR/AcrR family transcriptional regulator [unclassified Curtobacterium]|uniref:TetR/AcrR family transcriptional regulator n=1 Tax=unclassified Curtobacterium TaxID=257496 RepID=UPI00082617DD|nr:MULTISPECIES: TetR/AcrR family transcriptional regulator [unclassified Curtobacterium]WIA96727.1 helix-turn-helix domain-containing protein [Curtobacterium sp. MCBA15_004]WIB00031.1 helix-turn-helix domain-containing protein [Curtobacterium sp. MCBA15_012]
MSDPAPTMGLRDRKRRETRRRIADAARSLALEQDLDRTTIEQIAARADVSPRTFFNYFESKEDAVLGHTELDLSPATLDAHLAEVSGRPVVEAVVDLAFLVFGDSFGDEREREHRKEVIVRFPQLVRRQVTRMTTVAEAMTGAVRTILARDPAWGPEAATPEAAEMLLGMCMTGLRSAARHDGSEPAEVRERLVTTISDTAARLASA